MPNNEEKIKEFFSNEENVKKLTSDAEFMNKVSEGKATAETYVDEFKKLGMELSLDEAKALQEIVKTIMEKPADELNEVELNKIAGGSPLGRGTDGGKQLAVGVAAGVAASSVLAGLGCFVASRVYEAKSDRAYNHGDYSKGGEYRDKAYKCYKAGTYLGTLGVVPALEHYARG